MKKVEFLLFSPKPKGQIDRDLLLFIFLGIGGAMVGLGGKEYLAWGSFEIIGGVILACAGLASLVFSFNSVGDKEKLNGSFKGNLIFSEPLISVENKEFHLNDILKMEFFLHDYDGMDRGDNGSRTIPFISNGVGNSISLKMNDGTEEKFNFQLNYENEFQKKMRDLLIFYHLQDKISFLALIQYIGISDSYELILEFKKELEVLKRNGA